MGARLHLWPRQLPQHRIRRCHRLPPATSRRGDRRDHLGPIAGGFGRVDDSHWRLVHSGDHGPWEDASGKL